MIPLFLIKGGKSQVLQAFFLAGIPSTVHVTTDVLREMANHGFIILMVNRSIVHILLQGLFFSPQMSYQHL